MFDLITGKTGHIPQHAALPIVMSTAAQALVLTALVVIPVLFVTEHVPEIPTMMAFVATPPAPAPPPPPPAPAPAPAKPTPAEVRAPVTSALAAPIEVPPTIEPEPLGEEGFELGVPGGVEGGIPGGVVGGVVGGLPEAVPPPPPPPPPRGPVRIGGQIEAPALLRRVEPLYHPLAVAAQIEGIVILEAIVDRDGTVAEVRILRPSNPLLDREALAAVRQWRYSPLMLNGHRERFVLTVTLSFHLEKSE